MYVFIFFSISLNINLFILVDEQRNTKWWNLSHLFKELWVVSIILFVIIISLQKHLELHANYSLIVIVIVRSSMPKLIQNST